MMRAIFGFVLLLGLGACQSGLAPKTDPEMLDSARPYLNADLASLRSESRCAAGEVRGDLSLPLREGVFDERFIWADVTGRNRSVLVAFTKSCRGLRFAKPETPLCRKEFIRVEGALCRVKDIYLVDNEQAARAAALLVLIEEARAAGRELPAIPYEAALVLINEAEAD